MSWRPPTPPTITACKGNCGTTCYWPAGDPVRDLCRSCHADKKRRENPRPNYRKEYAR